MSSSADTVRLLQSIEEAPLLVVPLLVRLQRRLDGRFLQRMRPIELTDETEAQRINLKVFHRLAHSRLNVLLQFAQPDRHHIPVHAVRFAALQLIQLAENRLVEGNRVQPVRQGDQLDGIVQIVVLHHVHQQIVDLPMPRIEEAHRPKVARGAQQIEALRLDQVCVHLLRHRMELRLVRLELDAAAVQDKFVAMLLHAGAQMLRLEQSRRAEASPVGRKVYLVHALAHGGRGVLQCAVRQADDDCALGIADAERDVGEDERG